MFGFRPRALNVMKTLAASFGSTVARCGHGHAGGDQSVLIGRIALQTVMAGVAGLRSRRFLPFQDDEGRAAVPQRLASSSDAAEAADDDVIELVDLRLHAASTEDLLS